MNLVRRMSQTAFLCTCVFTVAFAVVVPASRAFAAAVPASALAKKTQVSQTASIATKAPTQEVRRFNPSYSLGYEISNDLAQTAEPRKYTHLLVAGLGLGIKSLETRSELVQVYVEVTGEYKSFGTEIEDNGRFLELSDIELSVSKSFQLGNALGPVHGIRLSGSAALPSSTDSRYEAIKGIFSLAGRTNSAFRNGRLNLFNTVSATSYAQTYRESPVSGRINPDAAAGYSLSGSVSLPWGFSLGVGGGVKTTHYLDSSQTLSFNNFQSITFAWKSFRARLKHTNGSYMDDPSFSLWYIDEYRRLVALYLSYEF